MAQRLMFMGMGVGFAGRIERIMRVAMMLIMHVRMGVRHRLVNVLMLVMFRKVQPHAEGHESAGAEELDGYWLAKRDDGCDAANERRGREVRTCPRRPEVAQCEDEQREAHAVTEEADNTCNEDCRNVRHLGAKQQGENKVERTCNQSLQFHDLQRIGE